MWLLGCNCLFLYLNEGLRLRKKKERMRKRGLKKERCRETKCVLSLEIPQNTLLIKTMSLLFFTSALLPLTPSLSIFCSLAGKFKSIFFLTFPLSRSDCLSHIWCPRVSNNSHRDEVCQAYPCT